MSDRILDGIEAATVLKLATATLYEWQVEGLLIPSGLGPRGMGLYNLQDLLAARALCTLQEKGITGRPCELAVRVLQAFTGDLSQAKLVVNHQAAVLVCSEENESPDVYAQGPRPLYVQEIREDASELVRAIEKLPKPKETPEAI